ncbi:UNVERIFIED_ORG: hypothetical protein M2420_000373 [Stenotrophomonas maltophilia]
MATTFLRSFKLETEWLAREYERAAAAGVDRASQLACEMAIVRLHDSWARCCRNIVLRSACGCRTLGGARVPAAVGVTNEAEALAKYFASFRRVRLPQEPKWHSARDAIDAAQRIDIRNRTAVVAALSSSNSPAEAMRKVRNYYAHRTRDTVAKAMGTGFFPSLSVPSVFNLNELGAGGETILRAWIRELRLMADAAML